MNPDALEIQHVSWQQEKEALRHIRIEVFVKEQNVPEELEWDEDDLTCVHLLAVEDGKKIGTARLLATGQIGRMAVLQSHRRQGIGGAMLERILSIAKTYHLREVFLNAQVDAVDFYKLYGFIEQGDLFSEADILHRRMTKTI